MEILELLFHVVAALAWALLELLGDLVEFGDLLEVVYRVVEAFWRDRNKD